MSAIMKKLDLDFETKIAIDSLTELPKSALATALVFSIAESISASNPPSDDIRTSPAPGTSSLKFFKHSRRV